MAWLKEVLGCPHAVKILVGVFALLLVLGLRLRTVTVKWLKAVLTFNFTPVLKA